MKKILSLLLVCTIIFGLCACGSSGGSVNKEEDAVQSAVRARAVVAMTFNYETSGSPQVTFASTKEVSEDKWEVSGKITVNDKYGDSYTCTYDAVVTYDPTTEDANVIDFNNTTPRKD